jgi:hypothetical protein
MKNQFYLWMLVLVCNNCFAQLSDNKEDLSQYDKKQSAACGGVSELFKKTGNWKRYPENDIAFPDKTFPASQYNLVLGRIEKVLPIMKEALPSLGGFEPKWKGSIRGNSFTSNGPVPSSFDCLVFTYYCNNNVNKILLGDEASALCTIDFNGYGNSFCQEIYQWDTHDDGKMISIYQLPEAIGKWKGLTIYEPKTGAGTPGLPKDRAVVVGHNGQMPWHVLTQKQYLTGYKNWLLKNKKEQLESSDAYIKKMKQNIADMQASKALTAEQQKSIVEKSEQQLKDFQDNTMQKKASAAEEIYNDAIKPVNEYEDTASAETLSQPAILGEYGIIFKGHFAKQGEPGTKLISFTTKYFNKALPRYVPQFFVLYWRWSTGDASSLKFAKEMEENFPVEQLKDLIDK